MNEPRPRRSRQPRDLRGPSRMAPFFFVLAVAPLGLGVWGCYQGWKTLSWPTAEARILGADARRFESERRVGDSTVTDVRHTVDVRYSYSAGSKDYVGEGIQPYSYGMQNSAAAREQYERYRPGTTATVVYNPDNPAEAYLEPGPSSVSKMFLGIGVIFVVVGFWIRSMSRRGAKADA